MSKPIFKVFYGKASPLWVQLSPEEREQIMSKMDAALEAVGAKRTLFLYTGWSSDKWRYAGVEEYPDIDAVQKYHAALYDLNWSLYFEGDSLLGNEPDST